MEAIDRLHTTAESHHRALIVEVMGRHAGWIALHARAGRRGERHPHPRAAVLDRERVCDYVESRFQSHYAPILVVAEGAMPDRGRERVDRRQGRRRVRPRPPLGGIGEWLAGPDRAGVPARRRARPCWGTSSGAVRPTAFDRVLATRFGLHAVDAVERTRGLGQDGRPAQHRHRSGSRWPRRTRVLKTRLARSSTSESEVFFG